MLLPEFALHITWTTYGSWLPGDERGHVSPTVLPDGSYRPRVNAIGLTPEADDSATRERARSLQRDETVFLSRIQARIVAISLVQAAKERSWRILRCSIMSNHAHVVIADCPENGPEVRRVLKGVSHTALANATLESHRWWTAKGSDRYKNDRKAVEDAVEYVANQEGILAEIIENEVIDS